MSRRLDYQRAARRDLIRIAAFIAETISPASAIRWRNRIDQVISSLANDAEIWPEADKAASLGVNLRFRMFGKKRVGVYRSFTHTTTQLSPFTA